MVTKKFPYGGDLLKHYVRFNAWLPVCQERLKTIRKSENRRLRYFTFCAIDAIDVLMLNVANVITLSKRDEFDTVFFFDKDPLTINEIKKRIPGAVGFPGKFLDVVLAKGPDTQPIEDPLSALTSKKNKLEIHQEKLNLAQKYRFVESFPFDVVNLDLQDSIFRAKDEPPGKMIRALRKVFEWQKRPLPGSQKLLDGFSLMFTTRIDATHIQEKHLASLKSALVANLRASKNLKMLLEARTGFNDVDALQKKDFPNFFKISVPKMLASMLLESDWYVAPDEGIRVYEFERRPPHVPPYTMLHFVMDVLRQNPSRDDRNPGEDLPTHIKAAYRRVAQRVFRNHPVRVEEEAINKAELQRSLQLIASRAKKYYPEMASLTNAPSAE